MNKRTAALIFLCLCLVLALLLIAEVISPLLSGAIFAVVLIGFGLLSRGFTNDK